MAGPQQRSARIAPMLARHAAALPQDDGGWAFEVKWDGVRAICDVRAGGIRVRSRSGRDLTPLYPELWPLGVALGCDAVLDGEVVAFDEAGRPSFQRLQLRSGLTLPDAIRRRAVEVHVTLLVFDLLELDGQPTIDLPYRERRRLLGALELAGPAWRVPPSVVGDGQALLEATAEQGLEGIVAKRLDAPYAPGRRSGAWLKLRHTRRQELVIGGWTEGAGARAGRIGALLVGYHDGPRLVYAGNVGSGFSDAVLADLALRLAPLARATSPFAARAPVDGEGVGRWQTERARARSASIVGGPAIRFVEPVLVCEVTFHELTRDGTLRHPSFLGLRDDRAAGEVVLEQGGL